VTWLDCARQCDVVIAHLQSLITELDKMKQQLLADACVRWISKSNSSTSLKETQAVEWGDQVNDQREDAYT
jgi:hypothetical protein